MRKLMQALRVSGSTPRWGKVSRFDTDGISGTVNKVSESAQAPHVGLFINEVLVTKALLEILPDGTGKFEIGVYDVWRFAKKVDQISVRYQSNALAMPSGERFAHPARDGKEDLVSLAQRFDQGQSFDSTGRIKHLPKDQDHTWQDGVLSLYQEVARVISRVTGSSSFLYSGTLLGYVRNNGFIPHDKDMDCAYLSKLGSPKEVADEFAALGEALVAEGFQVTPKASCISVRKITGSKVMVDIAHLFVKNDGFVGFPFGTVGTQDVSPKAFEPVGTGTLSGYKVGIPAVPHEVVEHIYGTGWRVPDPDFKWSLRRQRRDAQALLSYSQRSQIAMNDYYSRPTTLEASSFSKWLVDSNHIPAVSVTIDVGGGNGRDVAALRAISSSVVMVDRSPYAVSSAQSLVDQSAGNHVIHADILEPGRLSSLVDSHRQEGRGTALLYHRFILNGMTLAEEKVLFSELGEATIAGDFVAFEHRTEGDRELKKALFRSYRRFVNQQETIEALEAVGFRIVFSEAGTGLAPFGREDPHVARIIAVRA